MAQYFSVQHFGSLEPKHRPHAAKYCGPDQVILPLLSWPTKPAVQSWFQHNVKHKHNITLLILLYSIVFYCIIPHNRYQWSLGRHKKTQFHNLIYYFLNCSSRIRSRRWTFVFSWVAPWQLRDVHYVKNKAEVNLARHGTVKTRTRERLFAKQNQNKAQQSAYKCRLVVFYICMAPLTLDDVVQGAKHKVAWKPFNPFPSIKSSGFLSLLFVLPPLLTISVCRPPPLAYLVFGRPLPPNPPRPHLQFVLFSRPLWHHYYLPGPFSIAFSFPVVLLARPRPAKLNLQTWTAQFNWEFFFSWAFFTPCMSLNLW